MDKIYLEDIRNAVISASNNLFINKEIVNDLNVFPVPDGDTGTNMNMTFQSAVKVATKEDSHTIKEYLSSFSKGSLLGARGNSGVILSQIIRGFVESIPQNIESLDINDLKRGLSNSADVAYNAVMKPTEGTILTVIKDMATYSKRYPRNKGDILQFLNDVYNEGMASVERTPELLPILKESGVVDSGARGLMYIVEGILKYFQGDKSLLETENLESVKIKNSLDKSDNKQTDIKFGYCTEFILKLGEPNGKIIEGELRDYLSNIGDSIVAVGLEDVVKIHVHTNDPGKALQKALSFGSLSDIKVDNMREQHNEIMFTKEQIAGEEPIEESIIEEKKEHLKKAFIAVSSGEGFNKIYRDLGVTKIISGGQTMNPSTEDLLGAVEELDADDIFILPNNSNIILAANQVKTLTDKNVHILPTRSMPEGIASIISSLQEDNPQNIIVNAKDSIDQMKVGEVTYAVRGTTFNGKEIKEGQIIGIVGKDLISKDESIEKSTIELARNIIDDETSILSIYYGSDTKLEDAEVLTEKLEEEFDDIDIELVYGGQPLYYYILSAE